MSDTMQTNGNGQQEIEVDYELVTILREKHVGDRIEQQCIRERKVTRGVAPLDWPRFEARILLTKTNQLGQVVGQELQFVPFRAPNRAEAWSRLPAVLVEVNAMLTKQRIKVPGQDVMKRLLERGL